MPGGRARAGGRSNSPEGVPGDNRTEIISPANKQYKDRKSLAGVPSASRVPDGFKKK